MGRNVHTNFLRLKRDGQSGEGDRMGTYMSYQSLGETDHRNDSLKRWDGQDVVSLMCRQLWGIKSQRQCPKKKREKKHLLRRTYVALREVPATLLSTKSV